MCVHFSIAGAALPRQAARPSAQVSTITSAITSTITMTTSLPPPLSPFRSRFQSRLVPDFGSAGMFERIAAAGALGELPPDLYASLAKKITTLSESARLLQG